MGDFVVKPGTFTIMTIDNCGTYFSIDYIVCNSQAEGDNVFTNLQNTTAVKSGKLEIVKCYLPA